MPIFQLDIAAWIANWRHFRSNTFKTELLISVFSSFPLSPPHHSKWQFYPVRYAGHEIRSHSVLLYLFCPSYLTCQQMLRAPFLKYIQHRTDCIHLHCNHLNWNLLTGFHLVLSSPITVYFKNSNQDDVFEAWVIACHSYPQNSPMASLLIQSMSQYIKHDPQDLSRASPLQILWLQHPAPRFFLTLLESFRPPCSSASA